MSKRYRIVFAILIIAFVAGLVWVVLLPREPVYNGKPLSVWLKSYPPTAVLEGNIPRQEADAAVKHLGTNAIPTLLRMLRKNDSPTWIKLQGLLNKQTIITITNTPAWQLNQAGANGFFILGATASNAVPELIAIYHENPSPRAQSSVVAALGYIGPSANDAVPFLVKATTSTNLAIKCNSLNALGAIHAQPDLSIPALIQCLNSSGYSPIKFTAAYSLKSFGSQASNAVPHLLKLVNDSDIVVKRTAENALKAIAPEAAAKAGVK